MRGRISGGGISAPEANYRSKCGTEWAYIAIQAHIFKGPVRAYFGDTLCCRPGIHLQRARHYHSPPYALNTLH